MADFGADADFFAGSDFFAGEGAAGFFADAVFSSRMLDRAILPFSVSVYVHWTFLNCPLRSSRSRRAGPTSSFAKNAIKASREVPRLAISNVRWATLPTRGYGLREERAVLAVLVAGFWFAEVVFFAVSVAMLCSMNPIVKASESQCKRKIDSKVFFFPLG